ncbi:hypothetical protein TNCV_3267831 [Trichonephila clavipes]|nr:hypothetical protein TNCV_3267831 [Trichonephila clavipes]
MYSSALSIEIISDVEFSRRLVESRSDKLKQVKSCRKKQFNSPPQLENQSQCRRKTTQLVSRNETTQLGSRNETTPLTSRNETTQQVGTKQLNSSVGTKQLNSALPSTACNRLQPTANRLQPPTTACNRLCNACNRLQPPATAYRLQPPTTPTTACTAFTRLFLPTPHLIIRKVLLTPRNLLLPSPVVIQNKF